MKAQRKNSIINKDCLFVFLIFYSLETYKVTFANLTFQTYLSHIES